MAARRFRWAPLLRLAIGLALIAFLSRAIGWDTLQSSLIPLRNHPGWIIAGIGLTFLALLVGVIRWHVLLRTLGLPTPFGRTFQGYFIGQFFNAFLFGACGGDLVRALVAAQDHPEQRPEAVTSVFLDRAIGLVITLLFGCGMLLSRFQRFAGDAEARPALFLMGIFLLATIALLALFFSRNLFDRIPWLKQWEQRGKAGALIRRVYDALFLFRRNARHLLFPAVLSLANLLLLAAATAALARALEISIPFVDLLTIFPVITVLAAIPLTPGSLGIREGLYIQLLHPLGITAAPALMLSLLTYLSATVWSLFGAPFFLFQRARVPPQP